jgi:exopolysaccharide biosynthesis polyprenyl glycosylphosphotransferase
VSTEVVHGGVQARSKRLRATLVTLDVMAAVLAWSLATAGVMRAGASLSPLLVLLPVVVAPALTVALITWQRLYLARVCSVRSVEIQRLGRVSVATGATIYVGSQMLSVTVPLALTVAGTVIMFGALLLGRSWYRSWLASHRRAGRYSRRVVLVGANDDAAALHRIALEHAELGYRVVGVVAPREDAGVVPALWLGDLDDVVRVTELTGATGALIVATALSTQQVNDVSRKLLEADKHVQISSGLRGISTKRLKTTSLAHEPLLYVEQAGLSNWQLRVKRAMDLALSGVALVLTAPVLAVAAAAIKLEDGGSLLFSQERIGRDSVPFKVYKLRTMVPDAEQRLAELRDQNQRDGGPLFKLASDPRVTRVGKLLRASSIDELPQLLNVLRGDMSLVGPRPALAREVEQFDEQLRARTLVLPGITGMWQVEARDNPAFGPYRRLDLFYVENWSVTLDFGILVATVGVVVGRTLRAFARALRRRTSAPEPAQRPAAMVLD